MKIISATPLAAPPSLAEQPDPPDEPRTTFNDQELREHRLLRTSLCGYLLHSRFLVVLTSPLIYACVIPFLLLDIFISIYQAACFPVYGIPHVHPSEYLIFDRAKLQYLNGIERLNCFYCSYANGVTAYVAEIAARTEQHWCPIKHARELAAPHSRYQRFLPYGNAAEYRSQIEKVRNAFKDLSS